ncbi:MAG: ABC transporter ATP-binding protein [Candidatus Aminicenantes bacterium]
MKIKENKKNINPAAYRSPLLNINNLSTYFFTHQGTVKAVDGVSLILNQGEALGLVGESGCGKSVFALSLLRLISPPGRIVSGEIFFQGVDLLQQPEKEMQRIRGRSIAMVFQDPLTTLNPVLQVGYQIAEVLKIHHWQPERKNNQAQRGTIQQRVLELMRLVHIPSPRERTRQYPHQLSGGMRQRAIIAAGLACNPLLLIADEPTTALDVTVQVQILNLLAEIREKYRTSILLITHDIGTIDYLCKRVAVMYAGQIVEHGLTSQVFSSPRHPYTQGLLECLPALQRKKYIYPIPGEVPDLSDLPPGCTFQDRCPHLMERCRKEKPRLLTVDGNWQVRCHLDFPKKEENHDQV